MAEQIKKDSQEQGTKKILVQIGHRFGSSGMKYGEGDMKEEICAGKVSVTEFEAYQVGFLMTSGSVTERTEAWYFFNCLKFVGGLGDPEFVPGAEN